MNQLSIMHKMIVMVLLLPFGIRAQTPGNEDVLILHHKKFRWLANKEYDSLRGFLHPDVSYIHSNGWIQSGSDVIDDLKSGKLLYSHVDVTEAFARQEGHCVIVTGKGKFSGMAEGKPFSMPLLYTEVYVRVNDRWLLLQRHANRLP